LIVSSILLRSFRVRPDPSRRTLLGQLACRSQVALQPAWPEKPRWFFGRGMPLRWAPAADDWCRL